MRKIEGYEQFVKPIAHSTKQDDGSYTRVTNDYMCVDGRVAQFIDEHLKTNPPSKVKIITEFVSVGDRLLCQARVTSELYGEATGYAEVKLAGKGVDATNPFENAETSAVGRALGFLGYGLMGSGIASAEEVERAQAQQKALNSVGTTQGQQKAIKSFKRSDDDAPMSQNQRGYIMRLVTDILGDSPEEAKIAYVEDEFKVNLSNCSKKQASEVIEGLQKLIAEVKQAAG